MNDIWAKSGIGDAEDLRTRLALAIQERGLTLRATAKAARVTQHSLVRHLHGEHIRSDSIRKYEDWIAGRTQPREVFRSRDAASGLESGTPGVGSGPPPLPPRPYLVADVFSGCGGLSLGFDLLRSPDTDAGRHFRTVMALDVNHSAIRVLNDNHAAPDGATVQVGRLVDLTDFTNEAEVIAFYLDHVTRLHSDDHVRGELLGLDGGRFRTFLAQIHGIDQLLLRDLEAARVTGALQDAIRPVTADAWGQSSVESFHERLKFPRAFRTKVALPPVLWGDIASADASGAAPDQMFPEPDEAALAEARGRFEQELHALERKESKGGRGQLNASGRRIGTFVACAGSDGFGQFRDAWCKWQARRNSVRSAMLGGASFPDALRSLYERTYPVSVLLGGPPCQGFSRIGRGKIRSLHEASVHAHQDGDTGDARNQLYRNYVMVVSALRPRVFTFENVPQFQSTVRVGTAEFLATKVLTKSIIEMSGDRVSYSIASRTLDASRHCVPQTRQRFFMVGVRCDVGDDPDSLAKSCLALPEWVGVKLGHALQGMPSPSFTRGPGLDGEQLGRLSALQASAPNGTDPAGMYGAWVTQAQSGATDPVMGTDAHVARVAREDDASFYEIMGPGKRWMDYRSEDAPTLAKLRQVIGALAGMSDEALGGLGAGMPDAAALAGLAACLDGSLPLRLLLEQLGTRAGAQHHLAHETYLSKKAGNHGDWLTRLDANAPCRTIVAHMAKDSYGYVHPSEPRTLSVREAARVQAFPDWFRFRTANMSEAFRMIGNAVPPLLSNILAGNIARVLAQPHAAGLGDPARPLQFARSTSLASPCILESGKPVQLVLPEISQAYESVRNTGDPAASPATMGDWRRDGGRGGTGTDPAEDRGTP